MGCDIHLHVEIKIRENPYWHHYQHLSVPRNYKLFNLMAGVRGEKEDAIVAPRGLPIDTTAVTKFDFERWDGDAHTMSWLSAHDIHTLCCKMREESVGWDETGSLGGYLFGNDFSYFVENPEDYEGLSDLRFVFWFDN